MKTVIKATIGLMTVTMLSKVLGFIRETVLVGVYGAGIISDAYITSMNIPLVLFTTIGAALATTFIPLFCEIEKNESKEVALKFANNVFNIVIILSTIIAIIGFIYADKLTKIFAIDFTGEKLILATKFTRIMIGSIIFIGLSNIMSSWLQIRGNYNVPGMISIPYNIIIIIAIFTSKININIIAIGTLIGTCAQFMFQYPFARKEGFRYYPYINLRDENIKKMTSLLIPVFIGVGVNQINTVVDRSLASTLGDGVITILNSANRLNSFVLSIFIATIASIVYPILSRLSTENQSDLSKVIKKSINTICILIIPISTGAIVLSKPIVKMIFQRGQFNEQDTILTASALVAYSIGMIGYSLRDILNKVFYSIKDTKTPMKNGIIAVVINIILSIVSIQYIGYIGLPLSTSISAIICIILLLIKLNKKIGDFGQIDIIHTILKVTISSVIMSIVTMYSYKFINNLLNIHELLLINELIALIVSVILSAIVYFVLILKLKVNDASIIFEQLKYKIKK